MKYGNVPGLDKPVSRIVQGMMQVKSRDDEAGFALLDAVWEQGCRAFDTARVYGDKDAFLGKWVNARGVRDEAVILAKGAHHGSDRQRVTPQDIRDDLEASLRDMNVDYVDLLVLHRDDPSVPVGPIVDTLNELVREGKVRAFGGSNWTHTRVAEANEYAKANGLIPFACSSPNFSLAEQVKEPWANCVSISGDRGDEARRWYAEQNLPLFTWSSLAGGFFSGRFTRDNLDSFTDGLDKAAVTAYCYEPNFQRLDRVKELAAQKGVTLAQIATAYVTHYPLNVFALIGSSTPDEFRANLDALDLELTPQEMAYLELKADSPR
jgi:aryl-alcohol dehydrogenase-like predicted oxidoreductase